MNPDNITASHRSRLAYVYIRQSTQHQVLQHLESQRRQRSLVERAVELGWTRDRVTVVDEDLGQSRNFRGQEFPGISGGISGISGEFPGTVYGIDSSPQ